MPRQSVSGFRPTGLELDREFYSDGDIDKIIAAGGGLPGGDIKHTQPEVDGGDFETLGVPRRRALKAKLEEAAQVWWIEQQWQKRPTNAQLAKALGDIERVADKLLETMEMPRTPEPNDVLRPMPPALRYGSLQAFAALEAESKGGQRTGEELLGAAVIGVYQLKDWAKASKNRPGAARTKQPTLRNARNPGNQALNALFGDLGGIWIEVFERPLRTSIGAPLRPNEGKATGPMVRFLRACLEPLLKSETPSDEAIRDRFRRLFQSKSTRKKT